jgi:hypothetical protein
MEIDYFPLGMTTLELGKRRREAERKERNNDRIYWTLLALWWVLAVVDIIYVTHR